MSDFYEIKNILNRCERIYKRGDIFISFILEQNYFPFYIKLKKLKQSDIQKNYSGVRNSIKTLENQSFILEYQDINFKSLGTQHIPIRICFNNLDDFLKIVDKEYEYKEFIFLYNKIIKRVPSLKDLFIQKPFLIFEYKNIWEELLTIIEFLLQNQNLNLYIRELCIKNIDTKFIEKYKKIIDIIYSNIKKELPLTSLSNFSFEKRYNLKYPEPQIRFRILDKNLYIQNLSDITLTLSEFRNLNFKCEKIYIVENKITTLSFPNIKNAIVIFGQGYGVSLLKDIDWFLDKDIFYWGDIDLDGFAILSQVRGYYNNINSICMNLETVENFLSYKIEAKSKNQEKELINLNSIEKLVYERLVNNYYGNNFRLEQEKIPLDFIKSEILNII
ncbi:MAG: DUF2220 family protein [Campylobacterota bacterium]|nr:DUF2220 family protein [Campylobacterota bacterium]